jgi:hypothetical protein
MGKIIWLASYPKSGNTWVRAFLLNYIKDSGAPESINSLADISLPEPHVNFLRPFTSKEPASLTEAEIQALRPLSHAALAARGKAVFVKTHNANLAFHGIPLCTPAATGGAIYIVRDPRDTALSYSAYTGWSIGQIIELMANQQAAISPSAEQVFEFLSSWSDHVTSWVASKNRLLVRYEDLLAEPARYFARILRYIGTEPEPERLARAIRHTEFAQLAAQEQQTGFHARTHTAAAPFFRTGRAGQWQTALSPAEQEQIITAHGEVMAKLGYK